MSLREGLEAYWKLDEVAGNRADAHGSNTLTDNNTVTSAGGILGNAAHFDDLNSECLSVGDNASLSFGDEDFTIAGWIRLDNVATTWINLGKYDYGDNEREYSLQYITGSGLKWFVSSDGAATTSVQETTQGVLTAATWYFFACIHDSVNNLIKVSVNAGIQQTAAHATGCNDNVSPFVLGAVISSGVIVNEMDGLFDEVGVWRRALKQSDLTFLCNGGSGRTYEDFGAASRVIGVIG